MNSPRDMSDAPGPNENLPCRTSATYAMRNTAKLLEDKAKRMMKEAAEWKQLADALDTIEKYALQQSVDGSESGPHIGAGSAPEHLLWKLALDYQSKIMREGY